MAFGRSNKEIAQILYISGHTAKAHVRAIMTKLNADSRAEVIALATKHGWLPAYPDFVAGEEFPADRRELRVDHRRGSRDA